MKKMKCIKLLIVFILLLTTIAMVTGCEKKQDVKSEAKNEENSASIIGTWVDEQETYKYEYKEDGTAIMNGKEAKYTIEGDTLTIKYDDTTKLYNYKYTLNNTSLTLENEEGTKYVYVKK